MQRSGLRGRTDEFLDQTRETPFRAHCIRQRGPCSVQRDDGVIGDAAGVLAADQADITLDAEGCSEGVLENPIGRAPLSEPIPTRSVGTKTGGSVSHLWPRSINVLSVSVCFPYACSQLALITTETGPLVRRSWMRRLSSPGGERRMPMARAFGVSRKFRGSARLR